jgi:TolB-like protein
VSDVFISYERGSDAKARKVARLLKQAGLLVWLDADLPTHRAYSDVIREQLQAAKAVLVLWTGEAAQSEWVRAEADLAREQHKLVQASLDGSLPPLPFNQIHSGDLSRWRGDPNDPHWLKVVEGVTALIGATAAPLAATVLPRKSAWSRPRTVGWAWAAAVGGALLVIAASLWFMLPRAKATAPSAVAVMPFQVESASPDARFFANDVTDAIQSALSSNQIRVIPRTDAAALAGPGAEAAIVRLGVRLILNGSVAAGGKTLDVSVHLDDAVNHQTLWSRQFTGAAPDEVKASAAAATVSMLHCGDEAVGRHGLTDPQTLMLYLQACDLYELSIDSPQSLDEQLDKLSQVNARAPRFAPAFAMRAEQLATSSWFVGTPADARRAAARADANRALAIDPTNTRALAALSLALLPTDWKGRESILRRAQQADPDSDWANAYLGLMLAEVGRVQEAADLLRKANATNPLALDHSADSARMSALAGRAQEAADVAAQIAKSFPNNQWSRLNRLEVAIIQKDWDEALALLDGGRVYMTAPLIAANRSCLLALKTPSPALRAKARADLLGVSTQPGALQLALECLSLLGFVDDAFNVAQSYQPATNQGLQAGVLFSPETQAMRRDVRFMQLASRIGLARYWRDADKWPDFCAGPGLPYDCKTEAARLAAEPQ